MELLAYLLEDVWQWVTGAGTPAQRRRRAAIVIAFIIAPLALISLIALLLIPFVFFGP